MINKPENRQKKKPYFIVRRFERFSDESGKIQEKGVFGKMIHALGGKEGRFSDFPMLVLEDGRDDGRSQR